MTQKEKLIFFLNVYQCMYIHYSFKQITEGKTTGTTDSYFSRIKSYVWDYSYLAF